MQYSSAFAVSYWLDRSTQDGVLGLGSSDYQNDFGHTGVSSYLAMLKHEVIISSTPEEFDFLMMYLALRSPKATVRESWVSWNRWPTTIPRWCRPIPVLPFHVPSDGQSPFVLWIVPLIGLKLVSRRGGGIYDDVPNGDLWNVFQQGYPRRTGNTAEVVLDTGSSLSYVPSKIVDHLRDVLFQCPENQTLGNSATSPPFVVPNHMWRSSFHIEYKFEGVNGSGPVVIRTEADRFLCAANPHTPRPQFREGLICGLDTPALMNFDDYGRWIFGVNFFHTMYVAMAKPNDSSHAPYVKLAPQRDSETGDYMLPRLARTN
ncbi:hypothetical protein PYCCODRAFT_1464220 [Trametes coccinea BRFM310]|uniref:Acid protease n=1 Tax=Trametes coccinea (strain BRFM310) TaxID=1353009 RepID=A0A1Y2J147_TRAC3|nr:hypothetical protein PYCCODRAFT_1464220 [Trametes coccinea BRFM310]